MSRVGKKPILIPEGVEVKIEGQRITIKGPKGELSREISPDIRIETKMGKIFVSPVKDLAEDRKIKAIWGLTRALIQNMIEGTTKGYEKKLNIEGLGYRVALEGGDMTLYVGFSHPVIIKAVPGVKFLVEKNLITISGIDKELVGEISAVIRKVKPPEPYKGKGLKYVGEQIRKKLGKKAVTTGEK
jgi:large subunit ribosomal protein L6